MSRTVTATSSKTTASTVETLLARQRERELQQRAEWQQIVRQVARGELSDEELIERVLFESGHDAQDFADAVEMQRRRDFLAAQVAAKPAADAERRRIDAEQAKAEAELVRIQQQYQQRFIMLQAERTEQQAIITIAKEAMVELRRTADPELHQRYEQLTQQLREIERQRDILRGNAKRATEQANLDRRRANSVGEPTGSEYRTRAANNDRQAERYKQQIAPLDEQASEIEAEIAAVNARMLSAD